MSIGQSYRRGLLLTTLITSFLADSVHAWISVYRAQWSMNKRPLLAKDFFWSITIIFYSLSLVVTAYDSVLDWSNDRLSKVCMLILAFYWTTSKLMLTLYFSLGNIIMYPDVYTFSIRMITILPRLIELLGISLIFAEVTFVGRSYDRIQFLSVNESVIIFPLSLVVNLIWISWWQRTSIQSSLDSNDGLFGGYSSYEENGYDRNQRRIDRNNVLFLWLSPIMDKGFRRSLTLQDLSPLPVHLRCENTLWTFLNALRQFRLKSHTFKSFETSFNWNRQPYEKTNLSKSMWELIYVLYVVHGNKFLKAGFIKFCGCLVSFLAPVLLGEMVQYIQDYDPETSNLGYGFCLVGLLGSSFVLSAVLNTCYNVRCNIMQIKINGMLMCLVFHRAMTLPSYAWSEDLNLSTEQLTTLAQVDITRVANICQSVHDLWTLPLEIIVAFVLLYFQVREAFFAGVALIGIFIPINIIIAKRIGYATKHMMTAKDKRVQLVSEAIHGMKAIKMLAWEDIIMFHGSKNRKTEVYYLAMKKYLDALCVYLWASMPVLVPFITFTTTLLLGVELTAAKVFTTVALLNMLIFPMNAFPWIVNSFVEAKVSFKRIVYLCSGNVELIHHQLQDGRDYSIDANDDNHSLVPDFVNGPNDPFKDSIELETSNLHRLEFGYDLDKDMSFSLKLDNSLSFQGFRVISEPSTNPIITMKGLRFRRTQLTNATSHSQTQNGVNKNSDKFEIGPLDLSFHIGQIYGIVGSVGSGKSSILLGILNEIKRSSGEFALHVGNTSEIIGYCSQQPSLHGEMTIRENIITGHSFDESRYLHVLDSCSLLEDLKSDNFLNGDMTIVRPDSSNLSGGQRLRIGVARALYSDSSLILLDDPFSALDIRTATKLRNALMYDSTINHRTILVATHHVHLMKSAHSIIRLDYGNVVNRGSYTDLYGDQSSSQAMVEETTAHHFDSRLLSISSFTDLITDDENESHSDYPNESETKNREKSIDIHLSKERDGEVDLEDKQHGRIRGHVYWRYIDAIGFWTAVFTVLSLLLMQLSVNGMAFWLAYWVSHQDEYTTHSFIMISMLIVVGNAVATVFRSFLFAYGTLNAAKKLYYNLCVSIFSSSMFFFESTAVGRITNRIGRDTNSVDDNLPFVLNIMLAQIFLLIGSLSVIVYTDPLVLIILIIVGIMYYRLQHFYRCSSRELRRLDSIYRSPVYTVLADCLADSVGIRAMKQLNFFEKKFEKSLNQSLQVYRIVCLASLWLTIRLQLLGALVATFLALTSILCAVFDILPVSAALLGLSLTYSLTLVSNLNGLISSVTDTEKEMISVERVLEYIDLPPEDILSNPQESPRSNQQSSADDSSEVPDDRSSNLLFGPVTNRRELSGKCLNLSKCCPTWKRNHKETLYKPLLSFSNHPGELDDDANSSLSWPREGDITIRNLSMRYPGQSADALSDISISIPSGHRVAVVGRTGSGKSSLLRAILHLDDYEGSIVISDQEVNCLPRRFVRSRIQVIPQDPVLFTGTLRFNLDPLSEHTDDELNRIIDQCGLKTSFASDTLTKNRIHTMNVTDNSQISITDLSMSLTQSRDFIWNMLSMEISDAGRGLSQGQKQLICLARILLKPSKVILIDEATSSIDPETEAIVYDILKDRAIVNQSTLLCICHRVEAARDLCDYVMEMSNGKIVSYHPMSQHNTS